jgi:hypothetical protein
MIKKQDATPKEDPKYPSFTESMRDITAIVGKNPMIATSSKKMLDEQGKRVFRKFKDDKGVLSETNQSKSEKTVLDGS